MRNFLCFASFGKISCGLAAIFQWGLKYCGWPGCEVPGCRVACDLQVRSVPPAGDDEITGSGMVAVLAKIDTLPHSEGELAVRDGDQDAGAEDRSLEVGGHVIGPFRVMLVVGIVLRYRLV